MGPFALEFPKLILLVLASLRHSWTTLELVRVPAARSCATLRSYSFLLEAPRDVAVDVGAGTGQATIPLSKLFHKVVAIEPSEGQFANITAQAPNIELRLAAAEQVDSVLDSQSVDLLVVAQAIHWFNQEQFWPAVARVLKPGGTVAYWGYGTTSLSGGDDDVEANKIFMDVRQTGFVSLH